MLKRDREVGGRAGSRMEFKRESYVMQSCSIGLLGLLVPSTKWCRTVQIEGFSRTTAPGRLGKISICAVLHHFVNRNQEEFKGGPRCRRDGLESRRGV